MDDVAPEPAAALRTLVVDDEQPVLDELVYLLERDPRVGAVHTARSGAEALRRLEGGAVDLLFLDIAMPGLSGIDIARVVGQFRTPPRVVFVTAHEGHALEAFELGALDYLLKPIREERLRESIRRAVDQGDPAPEADETIAVELGGDEVERRRHVGDDRVDLPVLQGLGGLRGVVVDERVGREPELLRGLQRGRADLGTDLGVLEAREARDVGVRRVGEGDDTLLGLVVRAGEVDDLLALARDGELVDVEVERLRAGLDRLVESLGDPGDLLGREAELLGHRPGDGTLVALAVRRVVVGEPRLVGRRVGRDGQRAGLVELEVGRLALVEGDRGGAVGRGRLVRGGAGGGQGERGSSGREGGQAHAEIVRRASCQESKCPLSGPRIGFQSRTTCWATKPADTNGSAATSDSTCSRVSARKTSSASRLLDAGPLTSSSGRWAR